MPERPHSMTVIRTYTPSITEVDGIWAIEPAELVVWSWVSGHDPQIHNVDLPPYYVKGLMRPYINNKQCTLEDFIEALTHLGYELKDVVSAVRSAE